MVLNLTWHPLLDVDELSVRGFRIIIAICQLAGSLICLAVVDLVERRVSIEVDLYSS